MKNVLILNAHHYYPFSEGKLNAALIEKADAFFQAKGYQTRVVNTQDEFDVETELENHQWADIVFLQSPINWMGMTWSFKKYMDEVYTAGMGGALCHGDGRHQDNPKANYGTGGTLNNTQYMMSLTLNAPAESFADATDFFEGKSVDDLVFPMHMNFKFFGMQGLPTFACYDVMKNADIDSDFARFEKHLNENF
ncbi:NAD(P)H-dependent oxidoreductase [Pseudoalteromonas shioyasakiensis]|uniref:NAD(P)H-dependent oxidoreductase n=1 Tax=Pseudoalteromonas shioyasakiensis TaxID=1190813 RepID=A0ABT6U3F2_9GAMM|nr:MULTISPECIES: NAD(P)H-dependent oxidoreductase [Pseudoalteromonas]MDI4670695.1 NAD(P)H-dependent oxidoreductase [Pseudoalteromonas shioyasakiensis]MDI4675304.1 NAD(P)H-dependent oxidoreductase [Pseudoalteromonas shioyasakiensis]MDI4687586.1 NAD(P)H-dependent oxidoreductase [Pseudoalteromonas shioyasakiensis]MDI4706199.1 NAD(P)H-dependent oxidoreductase [Pseudoalteromonas shioyasakiensis]NUJ22531.1 NAD(P)H-dependent oxidoreductase [Pseudoalteromonas sp. 0802]